MAVSAPFIALFHKIFSVVIALFGIGFLIGFHELGHFFFCKLFGIRTPSFSIGFGPQIFSRTIGGTKFVVSAIPMGGFVEIAGAAEVGQGEQKDAHSTASDSFAVKPYYQKFLVMMGGIICNLLFAYIAFIGLCMTGIPKTSLWPVTKTTIQAIEQGSSAEKAGLQPGDIIHEIDETVVLDDFPRLAQAVQPLGNKKTFIVVERDTEKLRLPITIGTRDDSTIGTLGASFDQALAPQSFINSIRSGITITNKWIKQTVAGFASLLKQRDVKNVAGPVVIISILTKGATNSLKIFFILLAIISINLAILNLIPLPILDGGQLLFYTIEAIAGRPVPIKIREYIHIACWILVLCLVLYLSVYDIARIASPHIESIKQFFGFGR